jgi:hypothetical protein
MQTAMDLETVTTPFPLTANDPDGDAEGPVDIMVALFEALTSGERFLLVEGSGELHLVDARPQ